MHSNAPVATLLPTRATGSLRGVNKETLRNSAEYVKHHEVRKIAGIKDPEYPTLLHRAFDPDGIDKLPPIGSMHRLNLSPNAVNRDALKYITDAARDTLEENLGVSLERTLTARERQLTETSFVRARRCAPSRTYQKGRSGIGRDRR